jgi:hypothetical protein
MLKNVDIDIYILHRHHVDITKICLKKIYNSIHIYIYIQTKM